jgi:hypothetical protein
MTPHENNGGWDEWARHVLAELDRHNTALEETNRSLNAINTEITILKMKAGIWGIIGGLLAALTTILLGWLGAHK